MLPTTLSHPSTFAWRRAYVPTMRSEQVFDWSARRAFFSISRCCCRTQQPARHFRTGWTLIRLQILHEFSRKT